MHDSRTGSTVTKIGLRRTVHSPEENYVTGRPFVFCCPWNGMFLLDHRHNDRATTKIGVFKRHLKHLTPLLFRSLWFETHIEQRSA